MVINVMMTSEKYSESLNFPTNNKNHILSIVGVKLNDRHSVNDRRIMQSVSFLVKFALQLCLFEKVPAFINHGVTASLHNYFVDRS